MYQEDAMRIIAGEWRGRKLSAPLNATIRPTADRIRESIFSILHSRFDGDWPALRVADFCAGTGALGLETLSRGAQHATFVEKMPAAVQLIEQNISSLKAATRSTIVRADVTKLPRATASVEVIFFDPPYGEAIVEAALVAAVAQGWAAPGTLCILEQPSGTVISVPGWACGDVRRYGKTQIMLFEYGDAVEGA
jgi:16S rRNA (guanine966-N2)-methyltransferase